MRNELLIGDELKVELAFFPDYSSEIRNAEPERRLKALDDIYRLYYPFGFSEEIYTKLHLALLRSLNKKKDRKTVIRQLYDNRNVVYGALPSGIIGGSDSFTIIGRSGIGKSTAIYRSLNIIGNKVITSKNPFGQVIPALSVQTPFDASVRGLLLEILKAVDNTLSTDYYRISLQKRLSTDGLICTVSSACINHIGLLIVDEIQNVIFSKNGQNLVRSLTQLINNSGISICMVGTPECFDFFQADEKLARRSVGLYYNEFPLNDEFSDFCTTVWSYCYVKKQSELTDSIVKWLYDRTGGITANVITLIHDAQETAILNGSDNLNMNVLEMIYSNRMRFLHGFQNVDIQKRKIPKKNRNIVVNSAVKEEVQTVAEKEEQTDGELHDTRFIEHLLKDNIDNENGFIDAVKKEICVIEI